MRKLINSVTRTLGFSPLGWLRNTWRMQRWVRGLAPLAPPSTGAAHIGVVITPWLDTAVPWFTLAVGLLLARRGNRVTFLLDDSPFGDNPTRFRWVLRALRFVLNRLPKGAEVVMLPAAQPGTTVEAASISAIQRLARLNTVWAMRGETIAAQHQAFTRLCESQLAAAQPRIAQLVKAAAFDLLFIPGGVYGTSGLWTALARAANIRVSSFDAGGYLTLMLACNGIACQLQDIPVAFRQLKQRIALRPAEQQLAIAAGLAEMNKRRQGVDAFASQVKDGHAGDARYDGAVLLALNSSWDAAALGLHTVFKDSTDWIVQTVSFLLDRTSVPVIVRQHPAERLDFARTTDDYGSLLQQHFGSHPRLHFIAADQTINSYALLERVAAVVVYTSTIGTEAVAMGKPVITPSSSYYSDLGFVWQCQDLASYQACLLRAAGRQLVLTEAMRVDAQLCYYLTQCCNWVFTRFNPSDFLEWSAKPAEELYADTDVHCILECLQDNVPIASLNHLARLAKPAAHVTPELA